MPLEKQAELCFGQFLLSDMNLTGDGGVPSINTNIPKFQLECKVVVQVPFSVEVPSLLNVPNRSFAVPFRYLFHYISSNLSS